MFSTLISIALAAGAIYGDPAADLSDCLRTVKATAHSADAYDLRADAKRCQLERVTQRLSGSGTAEIVSELRGIADRGSRYSSCVHADPCSVAPGPYEHNEDPCRAVRKRCLGDQPPMPVVGIEASLRVLSARHAIDEALFHAMFTSVCGDSYGPNVADACDDIAASWLSAAAIDPTSDAAAQAALKAWNDEGRSAGSGQRTLELQAAEVVWRAYTRAHGATAITVAGLGPQNSTLTRHMVLMYARPGASTSDAFRGAVLNVLNASDVELRRFATSFVTETPGMCINDWRPAMQAFSARGETTSDARSAVALALQRGDRKCVSQKP